MLSLATVACGGGKDTGFPGAGTTPTGPTPTSTGGATQAGGEVEVGHIFFRPQAIRVKVGAKVTWEHIGNQPHTVTADDGSSVYIAKRPPNPHVATPPVRGAAHPA